MTDTKAAPAPAPNARWSIQQALVLAAACFLAGIAGGYMLHVWRASSAPASAQAGPPAREASAPAPATNDPSRLRQLADANAAPILIKLQSDPENPDLLTSLGNLYYDAQQYPTAVDYYARALRVRPADASVRTDMGTAYWYVGNADAAIAAFNQALVDSPNNPNTLFNRGLVKWQGKRDAAGALADWNQLLEMNPAYGGRQQVEQLIAEVQNQAATAPSASR